MTVAGADPAPSGALPASVPLSADGVRHPDILRDGLFERRSAARGRLCESQTASIAARNSAQR
jgi:hypothetical protein